MVITLILITSKAKYKNIQSIDLASGTINYTPADIDIVAINIENESGNYENSTTIPSSGYVLSDDSYCNVDGVKDSNVILTYQNGKLGASNITKRVKCTLYFDKYSAINTIIGDITGIQEKTSFVGSVITNNDAGIYRAPDDYGTSYYFRGKDTDTDNWVKFAGFYWRIIRVNGNGTIRIIYSGTANGNVSSSNKTGKTTQIGTSMYNHTTNDNAYVGYMMGIALNGTNQVGNSTDNNSENYTLAHTNIYDSDAKIEIDKWYKKNISNKFEYYKNIDINTGFCNDRQIDKAAYTNYIGDGYGTLSSGYSPLGRVMTNGNWKINQTPSLQCINKERDLFTTNTSDTKNIGNKKLTYPVGLITIDEAILAGDFGGKSTTTYLYTNQMYWTMSPSYYNGTGNMAAVISLGNFNIMSSSVYSPLGLRPIINLKADTQFTYNNETTKGSESDPFVVV